MNELKSRVYLVLFNLLYLIPFTVYYLSIRNYEFLWYVIVTFFFFFLILATVNKTQFDDSVLLGLSIWGLLHMAGGGVRIGDQVLYSLQLVPIITQGDLIILKFDQLVHFFGFGVATLAGYELLQPFLNKRMGRTGFYFLIACIGMGLGALNEMIEFVAVLLFPETGVGGYVNTSLDLVFNFFGALAALPIIRSKENCRIREIT